MKIEDWFQLGMKRQLAAPIAPTGKQLELGCGRTPIPNTIGLDWPTWIAPSLIPYGDNHFDTVWAHHFLEHLDGVDAIKMLREIERVLCIGGTANIVTPYYSSHIQAQDLDHKSSYTEETWKMLFKNKYYDKNAHWQLAVHTCFIIGIVERNICLFTQLVKTQ